MRKAGVGNSVLPPLPALLLELRCCPGLLLAGMLPRLAVLPGLLCCSAVAYINPSSAAVLACPGLPADAAVLDVAKARDKATGDERQWALNWAKMVGFLKS